MARFGHWDTPEAAESGCDNRIYGSLYQCPENCIAESISVWTYNFGEPCLGEGKCLIYENWYGVFNLVGETFPTNVTKTGFHWVTMKMKGTVILQEDQWYWLCLWGRVTAGPCVPQIGYNAAGAPAGSYIHEAIAYPNDDPVPPDPLDADLSDYRYYLLYCTYRPMGNSLNPAMRGSMGKSVAGMPAGAGGGTSFGG